MKKIIVGLMLLVGVAAEGGWVQLGWDSSPYYVTNPVTFKLYYGPASGNYTNNISVGTNLTATVSNIVKGTTYYFAATATDTNGLESAFSNEVAWYSPTNPPAPPNLRITATVVVDVKISNNP